MSFLRENAVTLNTGEKRLRCAVTDGTFGYFGTYTNPGRVIKVQLSDMTRVDAVTLDWDESFLQSAVTDGTFGYFGTGTSGVPGRVIKVQLSDMTRVADLSLNSGEDALLSAMTDGTYGYFGTYTTPGRVIKVRLGDMTLVDAVTLDSGEDYLLCAVTDGTYGYFGTGGSPGRVVKVQLSDMTRVEALTLDTGENILNSAVTDGTFGYFGTGTSGVPGRVIKVQLSDMTRVDAVTLDSGEDNLSSAVTDGTYGYFGTWGTLPGIVVKVDLKSGSSDIPTRVGAVTLNSGEDHLSSAVTDGTFVYFGTNSDIAPGRVVKINTGESAASSSGDPHIYPFFGNKYELPMKQTTYRMLQGEKLILNASTSYTTDEDQKNILSYYKQLTGEDAPQSLITEGIFYNNVFLKSEGHTLEYNFKTQKGTMASEYFTIKQQTIDSKQMNKYEKSEYIQQIAVTFTHSVYGKTTLNLNYFSNPQIKYGMSVKVQHKDGLTGLLVREYKCKSMECRKLRKTKKLIGKVGNNKVSSFFNV